jgi:hypothetical protein
MILEETYILTHHCGYDAAYIDKKPVHVRRKLLEFYKKELEEIKRQQEAANNKR